MPVKKLLAFAFAVLVALAAGVYKEVNEQERLGFKFDLPLQQEAVHTIDIAKQGMVKRVLQPNKISVYAAGQVKDYQGDIYVVLEGAQDYYMSQGGKKHGTDELKRTDKAKVGKNGRMSVSTEVELPKDSINQYQVATMYLSFSDGNAELGKVKVVVINSDYEK